ncbi:signal transduction protein [Niveomyces insectorum RCEF 264]|uniref:Signal transduction protein n=1 Tax=Niveomyces insectorum RCEF 264 TaxID=1081102 RepID=A0A167QVF4_9HYPO|nr:signal transduction protein [Niveomyces insectorum RCEF 264]
MKFAKELEQELVPEWRVKYLNYKAGKKYVKAVARAIHRANTTTPILRRSGDLYTPRPTPSGGGGGGNGGRGGRGRNSPAPLGRRAKVPAPAGGTPGERQSLTSSPQARDRTHYGSIVASPRMRSTSVATDGSRAFELPAPAMRIPSHTSERELDKKNEGRPPFPPPSAPAAGFASGPATTTTAGAAAARSASGTWAQPVVRRAASMVFPAGSSGGASETAADGDSSIRPLSSAARGYTFAASYELTPRQRLRRLFSVAASPSPQHQQQHQQQRLLPVGDSKDDICMRALDEVRERELDFFRFLDGELDKVETFYKLKEAQAGQRLNLLRDQLHEMRNRRIDEIQQAKEQRAAASAAAAAAAAAARRPRDSDNDGLEEEEDDDDMDGDVESGDHGSGYDGRGGAGGKAANGSKAWDVKNQEWLAPLRAKLFRPGPNSKALQRMPQTPRMLPGAGVFSGGHGSGGNNNNRDARRDYVRRPGDHGIPYRTAKRKLKLALQEFYRGLELLKAYALLNRTAFRKLNKKYDKAVHARPPYRYMNERVNRANFVTSTTVDELIVAVEDLYARYFERGNHKIAVGKLRALIKRPGDESGSAFRTGLLLGVGAVFAIQGTVNGTSQLRDGRLDPAVRVQTSYLLQIYGGYFLMLYLFGLFCLDSRVWTVHKVNYPFIFEFDPRSHLDWRQLAQFPSFFLLLFGLFIWLNFSTAANPSLFLYYPVILIGLTVVLLFFPAPTLWHRSRKWFLYSHWRLFFAGLYPVEFRDFFLGDIYCSLIYSTCNVALFFCLYAHGWDNPGQCNSNHSRLLGFFSTLPAIWRAFQCIRRYRDTRNVFPHLVNCGKYLMTLLSYMCLSLYRIEETHTNLALFITFSAVNSLYTSFWDLFMDFSLFQAGSRNFLLRDILALKRRWPYYAIMVADPILRFSWIFYAIFTHDAQHNTICSFMVSFAEATRRGAWVIFRVENEHCANVAQYKASRDVPLPYPMYESDTGSTKNAAAVEGAGAVDAESRPSSQGSVSGGGGGGGVGVGRATGTDGAAASTSRPGTVVTSTSPGGRASSLRVNKRPREPTLGTPASGASGTWMDTGRGGASAAEEGAAGTSTARPGTAAGAGAHATGMDTTTTATTQPGVGGTLRRRMTSTIGKIMAEAHKQDFVKKRQPGTGGMPLGQPRAMDDLPSSDDEGGDDEDDEDDEETVEDENEQQQQQNENAGQGYDRGGSNDASGSVSSDRDGPSSGQISPKHL